MAISLVVLTVYFFFQPLENCSKKQNVENVYFGTNITLATLNERFPIDG